MFQVFRTSDPAFASSCLTEAQHIFDLADTAPAGNLLTLIPFSFYPEEEWRDDLELGRRAAMAFADAGQLQLAADYLGKAAHWANAYITGPNGAADTLNLYD